MIWKTIRRTRGILLIIGIYSTLFWVYVVARIISGSAFPSSTFIDSLPTILGIEASFMNIGIATFLLAFISMLLWGWLEADLWQEKELDESLCPLCQAAAFWTEEEEELEDDNPPKPPRRGGMEIA